MEDFIEPNIAWQRITKQNIFCLTKKDMVVLDSMAFIHGAGDKSFLLLAILNSPLINFWIKKYVPEYGSSGYRLSNQFVEMIPVPLEVEINIIHELDNLVQKYIEGKIEVLNKIESLVYKIYDLNMEQVLYLLNKEYLF